MKVLFLAVVSFLTLAAAACAPAATRTPAVASLTPGMTPTPTAPAPTATPTLALSPTEVRYLLLDTYHHFFCDPHQYPISREEEEMRQALEQVPTIQANGEEFEAILRHIDLTGVTEFTDAQKLLVFREHKQLQAIPLEPVGTGYRFQMRIEEGDQGFAIGGTVTPQGEVTVQTREPSINTCPICLAYGTRIAAPGGEVAVEDLREGMAVWTQDVSGQRVQAVLLKTVRRAATPGHQVVRVQLDDGRGLIASPGHPTADGRVLADVRPGDLLDGARVLSVTWLPYGDAATYDILPAGGTGLYWANGVLLGSTVGAATSR